MPWKINKAFCVPLTYITVNNTNRMFPLKGSNVFPLHVAVKNTELLRCYVLPRQHNDVTTLHCCPATIYFVLLSTIWRKIRLRVKCPIFSSNSRPPVTLIILSDYPSIVQIYFNIFKCYHKKIICTFTQKWCQCYTMWPQTAPGL